MKKPRLTPDSTEHNNLLVASRQLYKSAAGLAAAQRIYQEYESRIKARFKRREIETFAGTTHLKIMGPPAGEPVFLWHGLGVHGATWFNQINALSQDYRLYVPDVIGSMGRSAPTRLERFGPAYGQWAAELMEAAGVPTAHHVGISNGGWLVLKLATADSARIATASLISTAGFVGPDWRLAIRMVPVLLRYQDLERARHFVRIMSAPGREPDAIFVEMIHVMLNHFHYQREPKKLSDEELSCLTAPTQILMGEHEAAFNPLAVIKRARAQLPNLVHHEIVPGVGHGMIEEDGGAVNVRLKRFLETQPFRAAIA